MKKIIFHLSNFLFTLGLTLLIFCILIASCKILILISPILFYILLIAFSLLILAAIFSKIYEK